MNILDKYKFFIFTFFVFSILTISYTFNPFKISNDDYRYFDRADEGNVMGRMVLSREKGIFYKGAITGQYNNYKYSEKDLNSDNPPFLASLSNEEYNKLNNRQQVAQLYDNYLNDREIYDGKFHPYKSQPGGQAMMYSFMQMISPFNGAINLGFFRLLTVALSALAFALFCGWIARNFGLIPAIITFLFIFTSTWFHKFAFNLWWALWSFYIPFLTMLLVLEWRQKRGLKLFDNKLILYLAIAVYLKFFFTGAEFITSALVAAVVPIIYYLLLDDKLHWKKKLIFFVKASIASCLTIVLGLIQLAMQIRYLEGTWKAGIDHVFYSYTRHNTDSEFMTMTVPELFINYMKGHTIYWEFLSTSHLSFLTLILVFSITSILIWFFDKSINQKKNRAIILTTAIAIAGPFSWLAFFPAHAAVHPFLDYIIWYIPYCLLGFIIVGVGINMLIEKLHAKRKLGIA